MTITEASTKFAYQDLFDIDPRPQIIYSNKRNCILEANQAAQRMYGYSQAEIRNLPFSALRKQQVNRHKGEQPNHAPIGYAGTSNLCWHRKKSGKLMLVEETFLTDNHANAPFFLISLLEVEGEKTPLKLLHEAYQKYKYIAQNTGQIIYDLDLMDNVIKWEGSSQASFFKGSGPGNIQQWLDLLHPDDLDVFYNIIGEAIEFSTENESWEIAHRQKDAYGQYQYLRNTGMVQKGKDGEAIRLIGTLNQIEEEHASIQEIKRNERRYNTIFQNSPILTFICEKGALCIENHNLAAGQFLKTIDEPDSSLLELFSELDQTILLRLLQEEGVSTSTSLGQWSLYSHAGEVMKTVEVFVAPLPADDYDRILLMFSDGTELSHAQAQYKNLSQRYQLALQATSDVIWDYDFVRDELEWGDNFEEKFGYESHQVSCLADCIRYIHPEDRQRVAVSIRMAVEGNQERWQAVFRCQKANGTIIHIQNRAIIERAPDGRAKRLVGAAKDITEKVSYVTELEARNQRLKEIAWDQSHLVRAPLARVKSLVDLIQNKHAGDASLKELLQYIYDS
ncbi:MAG: PAS domain-containing protein, partial [Phaeodactylibacter sp.]|nr:PAS domain-containing protein [Phaeodactylibacter sp.]